MIPRPPHNFISYQHFVARVRTAASHIATATAQCAVFQPYMQTTCCGTASDRIIIFDRAQNPIKKEINADDGSRMRRPAASPNRPVLGGAACGRPSRPMDSQLKGRHSGREGIVVAHGFSANQDCRRPLGFQADQVLPQRRPRDAQLLPPRRNATTNSTPETRPIG